jgi:heat shock protein HslJ
MTNTAREGPNATSDALAGTQWRIVSIDGAGVLPAEPVIVEFDHDGRVFGRTGVNELTASYGITHGYLSFGPLATTRRAGPPELMEQEARVIGSLAGMCQYHLEDYHLWIDGPLGRVELVSTAPRPEPEPERQRPPGPVPRPGPPAPDLEEPEA